MASAAAQLRTIAVRCREAGERENMNAVRRGIRVAAKPLLDATREQAHDRLPRGGGLNEQVANSPMRVSVLTGARTAGVRLKALQTDTAQTDAGFVRHPTFGRNPWVQQAVPQAAGWWTKTLTRKAPVVAVAIEKELRRVAAWLESA